MAIPGFCLAQFDFEDRMIFLALIVLILIFPKLFRFTLAAFLIAVMWQMYIDRDRSADLIKAETPAAELAQPAPLYPVTAETIEHEKSCQKKYRKNCTDAWAVIHKSCVSGPKNDGSNKFEIDCEFQACLGIWNGDREKCSALYQGMRY